MKMITKVTTIKMKTKNINNSLLILSTAVVMTAFQNCTQGDFTISEKQSPAPVTKEVQLINTDEIKEKSTPQINANLIQKTFEKVVKPDVDILFVVDNSKSMAKEQADLGKKFPNFLGLISSLEWRIAITSTSLSSLKNAFDPLLDGNLVFINNSKKILQKGDASAEQDFATAIQLGGSGSPDERGIYAANLAIKKNESQWIRPESHLAVVLISDEDERSTGKNLEYLDLPLSFNENIKLYHGKQKTSSFHSIIIQKEDNHCLALQNESSGPWGGGGQIGHTYQELTTLTNGVLGNICSTDYGVQLKNIGQQIQSNVGKIKLECLPFIDNSHGVDLILNGVNLDANSYQLLKDEILIQSPVAFGSSLKVHYYCLQN